MRQRPTKSTQQELQSDRQTAKLHEVTGSSFHDQDKINEVQRSDELGLELSLALNALGAPQDKSPLAAKLDG